MSMQTPTSRRGLFRSLAQQATGQSAPLYALRPPGAVAEDEFIDLCSRCGDCLNACPEQIIIAGDGGFPELSFSSDGCTGCAECIDACKPSALVRGVSVWPVGEWSVSDQCLPQKGVSCQSCKDACDEQAIQFPMTQATPVPSLQPDLCTACGACVSVCPTDAISINPINRTGEERRSR